MGIRRSIAVAWHRLAMPAVPPPDDHRPRLHMMGRDFVEMDPEDWEAFAGADPGSMICYCEDGTVLVFSQRDNSVTELVPEGLAITPSGEAERRWTFEVVR